MEITADEMKRSKDKNFDKWVDLASSVYNIIVDTAPDLRDDMTVIFIGHTQTDDEGFTRLLTNGKKLNKIGLEKYFRTLYNKSVWIYQYTQTRRHDRFGKLYQVQTEAGGGAQFPAGRY